MGMVAMRREDTTGAEMSNPTDVDTSVLGSELKLGLMGALTPKQSAQAKQSAVMESHVVWMVVQI